MVDLGQAPSTRFSASGCVPAGGWCPGIRRSARGPGGARRCRRGEVLETPSWLKWGALGTPGRSCCGPSTSMHTKRRPNQDSVVHWQGVRYALPSPPKAILPESRPEPSAVVIPAALDLSWSGSAKSDAASADSGVLRLYRLSSCLPLLEEQDVLPHTNIKRYKGASLQYLRPP